MGVRDIILLGVVGILSAGGGFWLGSQGKSPAGGPSRDPAGSVDHVRLVERTASDERGDVPPGVADVVARGAAAIGGGDPMAAMAIIQEVADPGERQQALVEMIGQLDAAGVERFLEGLIATANDPAADFDEDSDMIVLFCLTDRLVQLDQEAAASVALRLMEGVAEGSDMDMSEGIVSILVTAFVAQRDIGRARDLYAEMKLANPELDDDFISVIYIGAALDDPAAALRRFVEDSVDDDSDIEPVFELAGSRVGEMLDQVLAIPEGGQRSRLLAELFDAWDDIDPHAALGRVLELSEDNQRDMVAGEVLETLGDRDPLAALAAVGNLGEELRDEARLSVVGRWAGKDPPAALEWARHNLEPEDFRKALVAASASVDPELAVKYIAEMGEDERRSYFDAFAEAPAEHFVQRWATSDAAGAISWLKENGLLAPAPEAGEVAPGSPPIARKIAEDRSFGAHMAQAAIRQDFEKATAILGSLPKGEFREGFLNGLAYQIGRTDPAAAAAWVDALTGESRAQALQGIAGGWSHVDPSAAATYALQGGSVGGVKTVLGNWSGSDPEEAYRWIVGEMADEPEHVAKLARETGVLRQWATHDPAAAAEAMLGFPEDIAPAQMEFVTGQWAGLEPAAASQFIDERLEPGPVRDAAVGALVEQLKGDDLATAVAWAQTIEETALRYSILESLATH